MHSIPKPYDKNSVSGESGENANCDERMAAFGRCETSEHSGFKN